MTPPTVSTSAIYAATRRTSRMQGVMRSAVRDRLLPLNPKASGCPRRRRKDTDDQTATAPEIGSGLDALPHRYRPLIGLAVGTGWNGANAPACAGTP